MQQLIEQLTTQYKISEDDAIGIVNDIASYAEEKKEGVGSSLVNVINGTDEDVAEENTNVTETETTETITASTNAVAIESLEAKIASTTTAVTEATAPAAEIKEESFFSKATHFVESHIPDGITTNLKAKGEEMLEGVGSKLKGMFN